MNPTMRRLWISWYILRDIFSSRKWLLMFVLVLAPFVLTAWNVVVGARAMSVSSLVTLVIPVFVIASLGKRGEGQQDSQALGFIFTRPLGRAGFMAARTSLILAAGVAFVGLVLLSLRAYGLDQLFDIHEGSGSTGRSAPFYPIFATFIVSVFVLAWGVPLQSARADAFNRLLPHQLGRPVLWGMKLAYYASFMVWILIIMTANEPAIYFVITHASLLAVGLGLLVILNAVLTYQSWRTADY